MKKSTILTSVSLSLFMTLTGQTAFASALSKHEEILARRALSQQGIVANQENMLDLIEKVSSGKNISTVAKKMKDSIVEEAQKEKEKQEALFQNVKEFEAKLSERLGIGESEADDNLEDLESAQSALARLTLLLDRVPTTEDVGGGEDEDSPSPDPISNTAEIEKLERIIENLTARLTGAKDLAENPVLKPQMTKVGASFTHTDDLIELEGIDWVTEGATLQELAENVFAQLDPSKPGMNIFKTKIFGKPESSLGAGDARPSFVEKFIRTIEKRDLGELLDLIKELESNSHTKKADKGGVDAAIEILKLKITAVEESAPPVEVRDNATRYKKTQDLLAMADEEQEDISEELIKPLLTAFSESITTLGEGDILMGKDIYDHMTYLKNYGDTSSLLDFLGKILSTQVYESALTMQISTADGKNTRGIPANAVRVNALALLKGESVKDKFAIISEKYKDLQLALSALADEADPSVKSPRQLIETSIDYNMAVNQFTTLRGIMGNFDDIANAGHKEILTKLKTELLNYDRSGAITVLMADMLDQEAQFMSNGDITAPMKQFFQAGLSLIKKYKVMSALNTKFGAFHG